jgi:hypothetical protein
MKENSRGLKPLHAICTEISRYCIIIKAQNTTYVSLAVSLFPDDVSSLVFLSLHVILVISSANNVYLAVSIPSTTSVSLHYRFSQDVTTNIDIVVSVMLEGHNENSECTGFLNLFVYLKFHLDWQGWLKNTSGFEDCKDYANIPREFRDTEINETVHRKYKMIGVTQFDNHSIPWYLKHYDRWFVKQTRQAWVRRANFCAMHTKSSAAAKLV